MQTKTSSILSSRRGSIERLFDFPLLVFKTLEPAQNYHYQDNKDHQI